MTSREPTWRKAATADECAAWVRAVYQARHSWTPNFEGVQFTLGRAFYTHLEEDRADQYFADARRSDALFGQLVPGLQARMSALAAELVATPVMQRPGWCGPGVHIFPAREWLAQNGGDVHFDTEGLLAHERSARAPALSLILMLQPPESGGGLRLWDVRWDGADSVDEPVAVDSVIFEYSAGDLLAIDSYQLHQIQPFGGARDRISASAHLVFSDRRWHLWF